ncbi:ribonuclease Y [candidate division WWE3 bacterium]|nr:ribonuclease Y [candidate division WWE3 bacterium]
MIDITTILTVLLTAGVGFGVAYFLFSSKGNKNASAEVIATNVAKETVANTVAKESIVIEAQAKAKEIVFEARDKAFKITQDAQKESLDLKNKAVEDSQKMSVKKVEIEAKEKQLAYEKQQLDASKEVLAKKREELEQAILAQQDKLQKIAGLSKEEAKKSLLDSFQNELISEKGKKLKDMQEDIERESDEKAKEILIFAMRQAVTDYVVEYSTSKVKLPEEDMKGRIIGKEGRNIRAFEELTGVELELDETPGEIIISSFDPVRREIAKIALEKLVIDGRIQPAKIEEVVEKTRAEVEKILFKEGDNLCHRLGVYNLPKEIIETLGRFKYRFSYGQNMIEHSLEVTKIGMAIASEVGANIEVVKLGCLLHDIGKVLEGEGSHVQLGVEFLTKHRVKKEVIACVEEHHEDKPFSSIESTIVQMADHISGARPSARSEDYESYVKRMKDLEEAAYTFQGIDKAFAISAGREVRVFVKPEIVDDASAALIAREIARKIELEQTYPGVVKVTVIRETRVTETAK